MSTPTNQLPRMRPLDHQWTTHENEQYLVLRDRTGLMAGPLLVPRAVAILLSLCDGTRTEAEIQAGFELRTGTTIGPARLRELLRQLDEALILDGGAYRRIAAEQLDAFRRAPYRLPALAGSVYPADPAALAARLAAFGSVSLVSPFTRRPTDPSAIRGVISPHIDYHRGGHIYGLTWSEAAPAIREAAVVVIFGTDHVGGPAAVTLTRQRYATPWGPLPSAPAVVDALAEALGPDEAFAEELHHRLEHSIELAAVWVHYLRRDNPCPIVPILCGSFHRYIDSQLDAGAEPRFAALADALQTTLAGQRVVYVAAADYAHVGPVFGDDAPLTEADREVLRAADARMVEHVCAGDAAGFLADLAADRDGRRVCGLPPIYLMLRALGQAQGTAIGYDQCPADLERGSFVSIGGAVLW